MTKTGFHAEDFVGRDLHELVAHLENRARSDVNANPQAPEAGLLDGLLLKTRSIPGSTPQRIAVDSASGDVPLGPPNRVLDRVREPRVQIAYSVEQARTSSENEAIGLQTYDHLPLAKSNSVVPQLTHPDISVADIQIERFIGGGMQGAVYAATVKSVGLTVAVKVINSSDDQVARRAIREAAIGATLRHPNIVRVFECRKAGDFFVVVMELLQGSDLSKATLATGDVRRVAAKLSDALLTLMDRGIVHRDIKPANIILRSADLEPILIDLGLAVDRANPMEVIAGAGTPLFMPHDAFESDQTNESWDAYSLGVTVACLLTGNKLKIASQTVHELYNSKRDGTFESEIMSQLSNAKRDRFYHWIRDLISRKKDHRKLLLEARRWLRPTWIARICSMFRTS